MFRYARRRHLETEIKTFLKEKTNVELRYSQQEDGHAFKGDIYARVHQRVTEKV